MEPNRHRKEADLWLAEVIQKFDEVYLPQPKEPSVYRVVTGASLKVHAYKPALVNFGIYRRSLRLPLVPMEECKIQAVRDMLRSVGQDRLLLISMVLQSVNEIKFFYEDFPENLSEEVIAWWFAMDACFILQFLDSKSGNHNFNRPNVYSWGITKGIFKLENQIPLSLLLKILQLKFVNSDIENGERLGEAKSWLAEKLCHQEFFQTTPFPLNSTKSGLEEHIENASHLLDVLRRTIKQFLSTENSHLSTNLVGTQQNSTSLNKYIISAAEALHKNGIRFKRSTEGKVCFQNRWFGSTLVIPQLYLGEDIEPIVRNLMAFEDRLSGEEATISQFMVLMDCLVESKGDVDLLRHAEIIKTRIGSNHDIAVKFNNLCKGFGDNCSNYEDVARQLKDHGKNPVNGWINSLKEVLRSKPWYILSSVVATALLVMTALQTYYAAWQTYYASQE